MFIRPTDALITTIRIELEKAKKSQQGIDAQWLQNQNELDLFYTEDGVVQATAVVAAANAVVVVAAVTVGFAMKNKGRSVSFNEGNLINLQGTSVKGMNLDALLAVRKKKLTPQS